MCLITGETETIYVAPHSQPAAGWKETTAVIQGIWLHLLRSFFPDASRHIESFLGREPQGTKADEWEEEGGEVRGWREGMREHGE